MYGDADVIPTPESSPPFPASPYGIAKLASERYLNYYGKVHEIPSITLRLANVYGPRQDHEGEAGVVAIFSHALQSKQRPTIFGNGNQKRDFVFVKDVIQASLLALETSATGIYNIGTGIETSVNQLLETLQSIAGTSIEPIYAPQRKGEQLRSSLDASKAKKELGWSAHYSLQEGLGMTVSQL